ncbi:MAG TPA: low molecular weight protein arginine phosphatase [Opitutaceae bacterium]|jgi:protein-tyrosine-phosphatase|nr:low molecular weight protein arginine phosphatase [Opitutaceae bacterium]
MPAPGPILILCTANICRSPMAAALVRHALQAEPEPLRSVPVISAGVSARRGEAMTEYSVMALKKVGVDPTGHASQPLTQDLLDRAGVVFCMTEQHRLMIQATAEPVPKNLFLFREFMPKTAIHEIADPYGGPYSIYEQSRDEMVEAMPSVVQYLRGLYGAGR